MSEEGIEFVLHTYFRSSCSARVRIALNLKKLPYKSVYVNLLAGEQRSADYATVNPSCLVPTFQHKKGADGTDSNVCLTQSLAILEYLEEAFPDKTALLPPATDPALRAEVRALANIIACDVQPVTNLRILSRIDALGGNRQDWAKDLMTDGLKAYDRLAMRTSGRFSVGDSVTLADVCLVPAVWGAVRFGVDIDALPVVKRVFDELSQLEAVKKAHWKNQQDTPESLRV